MLGKDITIDNLTLNAIFALFDWIVDNGKADANVLGLVVGALGSLITMGAVADKGPVKPEEVLNLYLLLAR